MSTIAKRRLIACIIYIIFVGLKWIGVINWSWWIVLSPLIIISIYIALVLTMGLGLLICEFFFGLD
jgi:hypothetical protein